jgi:hypothetical protein
MTGWWWWDLLLGIAAALAVTWLALVVTLAIVRPRGGRLREALRLLPDVLRLVRCLAADPGLPPGVRVRLALLPWRRRQPSSGSTCCGVGIGRPAGCRVGLVDRATPEASRVPLLGHEPALSV